MLRQSAHRIKSAEMGDTTATSRVLDRPEVHTEIQREVKRLQAWAGAGTAV